MDGDDNAVTGPMANPPHPGELVRYDCLEPLDLTVTAGAKLLGVSRKTLDNLVNGRSGVSPEMAVRLSTAFGGSAQSWIEMQAAYEYAQVRKREDAIKATVQTQLLPKRRAS
jgi:addiction module HigA family antidote